MRSVHEAQIQGDSVHAVAYALMQEIAADEGSKPNREWILSTYLACLRVAHGGPVAE